MEAKHQHAIALEKQVEELKQELHQCEVQSEEKYKGDNAGSKAKDEVQVKSRDFNFSNLKGQGSHTSTEVIAANPEATTTTEPTGLMALKFILGVALICFYDHWR
ncbi:hypothetical protein Taro_026681 [Colocasia esculenta]|uniref:Uncharacterized protein n=1 Tax=Colocasia esculenta TaxID=4460 RepID=A0A843VFX0_COLES|nr:hypothetical protein [Colocasia esculenta]